MLKNTAELLKPAEDERPAYPHKQQHKTNISKKNHPRDLMSAFDHHLEPRLKKARCCLKASAVN